MGAREWRCRRRWLCGWLLAFAAACWPVPAASAQSLPDWVDKVYRAPPPAELTDALIDALGDPRWVVRDSATRWLGLAGPELLEPLRHQYHQTLSQEVRLRIRQVAQEIFLRDRLDVNWGFIGIRMGFASGVSAEIMGGAACVGIPIQPMPHSAATEAGLQPGDVIVMVDGERFVLSPQHADEARLAFSRRIRQGRPNDVITLTFVRDGKLLNREVTLMPAPSETAATTEFGQTNPSYSGAHDDFRSYWTEHFTVPNATQPPATSDESYRPL
jgi:hypothetical protein